jgi:hypothetical protein
MALFQPGQWIELREVWAGQTWELRRGIVVRDAGGVVAVYTPPYTPALIAAGPDGVRLRLPPAEWEMREAQVPADRSFLAVHAEGADHSVLLIRDGASRLLCWYINLESDLERTAWGFEYRDHFLDVLVEPDMSGWRWKDEDELAEALERHLVSTADCASYYAEGQRAVDRLLERVPPYDEPWEDWAAPAAWSAQRAPAGWQAMRYLTTSAEDEKRGGRAGRPFA